MLNSASDLLAKDTKNRNKTQSMLKLLGREIVIHLGPTKFKKLVSTIAICV
jgi:hypothetical protein